ncbi:superoxide dismutase [Cu-Zn]-like isoform X1 [Hyposmocoma kahamanoa]|uniref:superoxide dismutase [Cu-Zn]-like isoform X1 n=1 Tax=Hyposmocoma kahamanoa TaxID=1477025 RepID=UPI000E6D860F|nr:superoxide dismutase [Cu-Zn]-like isoform X1 [Hyposmocoma kahamanoa]
MNLRLHVFFGQLLWLFASLSGKSFQGVPGYGRNLIIKTLPAIEDYQSNVYEVFMEPYLYDSFRPVFPGGERTQKQIDLAGAPRSLPGLQAVVNLQPDAGSGVTGELVFTQIVPNGPVTIEGNVTGLTPGLHGVHVHQSGAIKDNCKDIGPHFIAYYGRHGGPRDHIRHVGDLGNIKAEEGTVNIKIVDHLVSLSGPRSIVGRSLAITQAEDDYGRAGTEDSALTGSSGPAIACGIIGYLN